jgi:hypothetical protein
LRLHAIVHTHCPKITTKRTSIMSMSFRTIAASALLALSLIAGGANAYAASATGEYDSYPAWAQRAFEPNGGG